MVNSLIYEQDYSQWLQVTLEQLESRDLANIDWQNLAEEIRALGNEQKHKVESYLRQLIKHLLLYQYWESEKNYCAKDWLDEIDNFRSELDSLLESKVLYNHCENVLDKIYLKSRNSAMRKSAIATEVIPVSFPYSLNQILDFEWLP
jgi:hypothetical protein